MCKSHVNTKPFYISDLNNHRFWYLWQSWSKSLGTSRDGCECVCVYIYICIDLNYFRIGFYVDRIEICTSNSELLLLSRFSHVRLCATP